MKHATGGPTARVLPFRGGPTSREAHCWSRHPRNEESLASQSNHCGESGVRERTPCRGQTATYWPCAPYSISAVTRERARTSTGNGRCAGRGAGASGPATSVSWGTCNDSKGCDRRLPGYAVVVHSARFARAGSPEQARRVVAAGREVCFQRGKLPEQIRQRNAGSRQQSSTVSGLCRVCRQGLCLLFC